MKYLCIRNYYYNEERITFTKGKIYTMEEQDEDTTTFMDDESDFYFFTSNDLILYFKPSLFKYGK